MEGFTSRILWYFPTPIYSRLADLELSPEEREIIEEGERTLGEHLNIFHMGSFISQQILIIHVSGSAFSTIIETLALVM